FAGQPASCLGVLHVLVPLVQIDGVGQRRLVHIACGVRLRPEGGDGDVHKSTVAFFRTLRCGGCCCRCPCRAQHSHGERRSEGTQLSHRLAPSVVSGSNPSPGVCKRCNRSPCNV